MRTDRIELLIASIENYGNLYMGKWQKSPVGQEGIRDNLCEFHVCGNSACVGGHMALLPEFKESGGTMDCYGAPALKEAWGSEAVAEWLELDVKLCEQVFGGNPVGGLQRRAEFKLLVRWAEWTAADAVKVLRLILSGELK